MMINTYLQTISMYGLIKKTLFFVFLFFGANNLYSQCPPPFPGQADVRPDFTPGDCPANDVQVDGVYLDLGGGCVTCEPGEMITTSLLIDAYNNPNSDRYLAVIASVEYTLPDGSTTMCDILVCEGPLDGQSPATINAGQITFECGTALNLTDILLIYDVPSGECPILDPPNGKYCYLSTDIAIDAFLMATLTAECVAGANAINVNATISGGDGNFTYSWSNGATTEDLLNVPPGMYTVTVTDGVGCTTDMSIDFQGPCCTFDVSCSPDPQTGTYDCNNPVPDPIFDITLLGDYGIVINDNCGEINIEYSDNEPDYCSSEDFIRTVTITDDGLPGESYDCNLIYNITAVPIIFNCPDDFTLSGCIDQQDIDDAFDGWVLQFSFSGGCEATSTLNNADFPNQLVAPSICGGSVGAVYQVFDDCNPDGINCTANFTIESNVISTQCPNPTLGDAMIVNCFEDIESEIDNVIINGGCEGIEYTVEIVGPYGQTSIENGCNGDVYIISYTVEFGECMISEPCDQFFIIEQDPPEIFCPDDRTFDCYSDWISFQNGGGGNLISSSSGSNTIRIEFNSFGVTFLENLNEDLESVLENSTSDCNLGLSAEILSIDDSGVDVCSGGEIYVSYQIMDECGQTDDCVQTITVLADENPPTADPLADIDVPACSPIPEPDINLLTNVVDFCANGTTIEFLSDNPSDPTCDEVLVIRTYVISDQCGNESFIEQNINLTPPDEVVVSCPDDLVVGACDYSTPQELNDAFDVWLSQFDISGQGCGVTEPQINVDGSTELCLGQDIVITASYNISDGCTTSTCTRTFTQLGYESINLSCPLSVSYSSCDFADQDELDATFQDWIAEFNVSGGCNINLPDLSVYSAPLLCSNAETVVEINLSDICTTANCIVSFSIEASEPVSLSCPTSVDVSGCIFDSQQELEDYFYEWLGEFIVVNEGCGVEPIDLSQYLPPLLCETQGQVVTVSISITDGCSSADCFEQFELTPRELPIVSCPGDVSYSTCQFTDQQDLADIYNAWVDEFVIVEDGCVTISNNRIDVPDFCSEEDQVITIDFGESDVCFSDACSATFTLTGTSVVEVNCPGDVSYDACNINNQAELEGLYNSWLSEFYVINAGCGVQEPDLSIYGIPQLCPNSEMKEISIDYNIDDNCSEAGCTATFTITPTPSLVLECPDNLILECNQYTEGDVQDWLAQVKMYEGCSSINVSNDYIPGSLGSPCKSDNLPFEINITFFASDQCETLTCTSKIIVQDTQNPTINCPPTLTLEYGDDGNDSEIQDWIDAVTGVDICSDVIIYNDFELSDFEPICDNNDASIITFTIKDQCGNANSCTSLLEILDTTPPEINCPADLYINCEDSLDPNENIQIQNWLNSVLGSDYGGGPISITDNYNPNNFTAENCPSNQFQVVTFQVEDQCLNVNSCTATLYLRDVFPPIITVSPMDMDVPCSSSETHEEQYQNWLNNFAGILAEDACSDLNYSYQLVNDFIGCGNTFIRIVLFYATDLCGNSASEEATFTVVDDAPPYWVTGAEDLNMTFNCVNPDFVPTPPTYMDDCNPETVELMLISDVTVPGDCPILETRTVVWQTTDICGNDSEYFTAIYTFIDDKGPIIDVSGYPGLENVVDGSTINFPCTTSNDDFLLPNLSDLDGLAIDNCEGDVTIEFFEDVLGEGNCIADGYFVRYYCKIIATDECNNESNFEFYINIVDDTPPTFENLPEDYIYVDCDNIPPPDSIVAFDACICAHLDFNEVYEDQGTFCKDDDVITRTWIASDHCGNYNSFTQTLDVVDNQGPNIVENIYDLDEYYCYDDVPEIGLDYFIDCSGLEIISIDEEITSSHCSNVDILGRTFDLVDECGNYNTVTIFSYILTDDFTDMNPTFVGNLTNGVPVNSTVTWTADYYYGEFVISSADFVYDSPCGNNFFITPYSSIEELECNEDNLTQRIYLEWLLSDICRNEQLYYLEIFIEGDPQAVIPSHLTIGCDEDIPEIEMAPEFRLDVIETITEGPCDNFYTMIRDFIITDECDNTSEYTQTIDVIESTPDFLMDSLICYEIVEDERVALDVCSGEELALYKISTDTTYTCDDLIRLEYVWETEPTVCGNVYTLEQTAILGDFTAPTFVYGFNSALEEMINGNGIIYTSETEKIQILENLINYDSYVTATDQCNEYIQVQTNHSIEYLYCNDEQFPSMYARISLDWYAEDACGNFNLRRELLGLYDDTAPVIQGPADITLSNCQSIPEITDPSVSDDNMYTVTYTENVISSDPLNFIIERIWTATDYCGNSSSHTQLISGTPTDLSCEISYTDNLDCNSPGHLAVANPDGTGPFTYEWSISGEGCQITSITTSVVVEFTMGYADANLILTVTDGYGCSTSCSVLVTCTEIPKDDESEEEEEEDDDPEEEEDDPEEEDNDGGNNLVDPDDDENQATIDNWEPELVQVITTGELQVNILESETLGKDVSFQYFIVGYEGHANSKRNRLQRLMTNSIDISNLTPGLYLLVIQDSRGIRKIKRFIKV